MKEEIKNVLSAALDEARTELDISKDELSSMVVQRAAELSLIVGQPGYQQAAVAARDDIALATGLAAVHNVDGAVVRSRQRVIGVIQGALGLAAQMAIPGKS